ncbi:hypothetical protein ACS0TY_033581 [Phlomoides rotata]
MRIKQLTHGVYMWHSPGEFSSLYSEFNHFFQQLTHDDSEVSLNCFEFSKLMLISVNILSCIMFVSGENRYAKMLLIFASHSEDEGSSF